MKLCIVTNYWKESHGGGIRTQLVNLWEELKDKGITPTVIFRLGRDNDNIHVSGGKILFVPLCLKKLVDIQPNVVHSQEYWYCLCPCILYKEIFNRKAKVIHTFRSEPDQHLPKIFKFFYQMMVDKCDCVTFVSKGLMDILKMEYNLQFSNFRIIYPGVKNRKVSENDIEQFKKRFRIPVGSELLLVQAFTANKLKIEGAKLVVDSLAILQKSHPFLFLLITRDGLFTHELVDYARQLGILEKVIFTGDVDNPFVPLAMSDIFIFPWLGHSGVGNALLEAMIVGKPIIVTSNTNYGVSEVIAHKKNGLVVPPDAEAIAEMIDLLLHDTAMGLDLGNNAKKDAEDTFSWPQCANQYAEIYLDLNSDQDASCL